MRALPDELIIKPSGTDGLGLFATRDIVIFPSAVTHIHHPFLGWIRTAVGAFINHSQTPNCVIHESKIDVESKQIAIDGFNLDRYLLGSRHNEGDGIIIKVRSLLQNGTINQGDEITIEYEDVLHHGLRNGDTQISFEEKEKGPTKEDLLREHQQ